MNHNAFVIWGHQIGLSEIMLLLLAFFVMYLIVRNIALYQLKPRQK